MVDVTDEWDDGVPSPVLAISIRWIDNGVPGAWDNVVFEDALSAATALEQGKFVERPTSVKEEYSISWLSGADAEKIGSQYFDEGHLADLLNKFDAVEDLRSLLSFVQALHVSPAVDVSVTASELLRDMAMFIDNAKDDILSQYHDLSPRAWKLVAHLLYAAAPEAAGDSSA